MADGFINKGLLLHACCAPCSLRCVRSLTGEGYSPVLFFYNPNIHPYSEYMSRKQAIREYSNAENIELIEIGSYRLKDFLNAVDATPSIPDRCKSCYTMRLDETAAYAAREGFEAFSTTLLISPYQNHAELIIAGERAAAKHGVQFLYRDFRPLFQDGQNEAKKMGLYMQKYCGCILSEGERFFAKT